MSDHIAPEAVVQRQLDAYNARDMDAWLATYSHDAQQFEHPGKLLATGHAEIRARMGNRFAEPNLQAQLLSRFAAGRLVVDHEIITRDFPQGVGTMVMTCIYEVVNGLIRSASFTFDAPVISVRTEPAG